MKSVHARKRSANTASLARTLETLHEYFRLCTSRDEEAWNRSRFATTRFHRGMKRRLDRVRPLAANTASRRRAA